MRGREQGGSDEAGVIELDYSAAGVPVRDDLKEAHRTLWEYLRAPGTWWTGAERVAIVAESRNALTCELCRERRRTPSPEAVRGEHRSLGALPAGAVHLAHRVRTDPARLSRKSFERARESGLDEGKYVELIGLVAMAAGVDHFARALGIEPFPLPAPLAGEPSRYRPRSAREGTAWVAVIAPEEADGPEADLYGDAAFVPNIVRAMSLVPDHVRMLRKLSGSHYVSLARLQDPTYGRGLDRMQMELVAARVSALNECFY